MDKAGKWLDGTVSYGSYETNGIVGKQWEDEYVPLESD